ncbi:MAG: ATP-binding protein [Deltaproteobacteria bacterium]|nr:ATP-binding protein [Deltaproteobacteria bacterium]
MESIYYALSPWWEKKPFDTGIQRDAYLHKFSAQLERRQVEILIGSRRSGKTTILKQFINTLLDNGISEKDILYLPLDHPNLSAIRISEHLKNFRKIFGHGRDRKLYLFLDEIQDNPDWETEIKSLYDSESLKIFCSGSSSSLIARQGGKLTGRQIISTVYPLSFSEFLMFRGGRPNLSEDYKYETLVAEYLDVGGYPEHVLHPSQQYMTNLLDDILARDLIRNYPIKKPYALRDLIRLIAASTGSRISFNKLSKILGLSLDTVKDYVSYLEEAFLLQSVEKWSASHSERIYAQKKIYLCDNGIRTLLIGPGDDGSKAETAVFMELKRNSISCGYYAESEREVDFITGSYKAPLPVEAKYVVNLDWKDKRLTGLRLFLRRFPKTKKIFLVTMSFEGESTLDNAKIMAVPLWKFLLRIYDYLPAGE